MSDPTKFRVKFYLEKRGKGSDQKTTNIPINVSITFSSKRVFYSSREKCNLGEWGEDNQRVIVDQDSPGYNRLSQINSKLSLISRTIDRLFEGYHDENITPECDRLLEDLRRKFPKKTEKQNVKVKAVKKAFFETYREYINKLDLSPGRIKKHNTTFNKVKSFNSKTTFEIIDTDYLKEFQAYLRKKGGREKVLPVLPGKKPTYKPAPLAENTVISEIKRFKAFLHSDAVKKLKKGIDLTKFETGPELYGEPIFITTEERDKLFDAKIQSDRLARVRDLFVLQCYLGCRVGDYITLKRSDIIDGCIQYVAAKTRKKTVRYARVPITPKAWEIINRYNLPNGDLMPFITDQKYNVYIKELFRLLEINRMVTVVDPKTKQHKQVPICELASSHMARRVFVGSLYKKGVKNEIIGSMSGHAEGSRAFSRYHGIDKEQQQEAIKLIE